MKKEQALLTEMLEKIEYKNNPKIFFGKLLEEELLLPFYENHLVELYTDKNKKYIPLFTDRKQIKNIEYTRLDKVKLEEVIKDIFKSGKYYAISINPYTHDFIMNEKVINVVIKLC